MLVFKVWERIFSYKEDQNIEFWRKLGQIMNQSLNQAVNLGQNIFKKVGKSNTIGEWQKILITTSA